MPTVLIIGDDPDLTAVAHALGQRWTVLEALDRTMGLTIIRTQRAALSVVLLVLSQPHDGVLAGVQIRTEAPQLPIIPVTNGTAPTALRVLSALGCAPPLFKPVTLKALGPTLQQALAFSPPPLESDQHFLLSYLHELAATSEQALFQQRSGMIRAAVLASSELLRAGLREAVIAAGGDVRTATTRPAVLYTSLAKRDVAVLVADSGIYPEALPLGQQLGLPLLVVARTVSTAFRIDDIVAGVVVEPVKPATLATALSSVAVGSRYRDPVLDTLFTQSGLTRTERTIVKLIIKGLDPETIAVMLALQPQTLRWHLANIYPKLGVTRLDQILRWIDTWPPDNE